MARMSPINLPVEEESSSFERSVLAINRQDYPAWQYVKLHQLDAMVLYQQLQNRHCRQVGLEQRTVEPCEHSKRAPFREPASEQASFELVRESNRQPCQLHVHVACKESNSAKAVELEQGAHEPTAMAFNHVFRKDCLVEFESGPSAATTIPSYSSYSYSYMEPFPAIVYEESESSMQPCITEASTCTSSCVYEDNSIPDVLNGRHNIFCSPLQDTQSLPNCRGELVTGVIKP